MLTRKFSRREVIKMSGAAAAAALLAACQPKVVEKIVEKEVTKVVEVEKKIEKVTIDWITPGGLGLERTMYTNFSYKFMEENPTIKVKVSFESWGDYWTKLPTILAAGVTPDVIHQHWSTALDYAYQGVLLDVVPFMQRDDVRAEEFLDGLIDEYSHKGKIFGLPKDSAAQATYYNKTMFDAAGVEYPKDDWTMDDFRRMCLELTRDDNGYPASDPKFDATKVKQWGYQWVEAVPTGAMVAFTWVNAMGTNWYDEDFTESFINHPAAVEYMQMVTDLRCKAHAVPSPGEALGQGNQWRASLCAMCNGHHSTTFFAKQEKVRFEYDCTYIPAGPGGQYVATGSSAFCLTTNAAHKDEGWEFLKFLTSEETQEFIGQQKRWGVNRKAIVHAIEPNDGYPEHFAMAHTDPFKEGVEKRVSVFGVKNPPMTSRIKEICRTEFDPVFTCGGGDVREAADRAKKQIDAVLAEIDW